MPGTPVINVAGLATIKIASPSGGTLDTLGYTMNGAEITERNFVLDVYGDENGGDAGPPIDVQQMGEAHEIRLLLTKYDDTILDKLRARIAGGTAGTPSTAGTLMFPTANNFRLLIHSVTLPRNYLNVVFREAFEINKGTKHSQALVIGTGYKDAAGVIYNATTT